MKRFFLSLAFLYVWGVAYYYSQLPKASVITPIPEVEAIAVFTGGSGRIEYAAHLVEAGFKAPVLITGVHPQVTKEKLVGHLNEAQQNQFVIDHTALSTKENVVVTAAWAEQNGFKNVGIVTSYYHMPRSWLLLGKAIASANFVSLPVYADEVPLSFFMREYHKFILAEFQVLASALHRKALGWVSSF